MGKSGSFDAGAGALAPRTDEFLAGVLALSRISRVTVALESGQGAGPALLAAARLTAHAETCVLFDQWHGDPLAALAATLFHARPDLAADAGDRLAHGLRKLQAQQQHSFLIIFDRFDEYLAQAEDQPQVAAFAQAFVQMANDSELDVHFLLVQDEASESLLNRFQHDIPGIGDGCLRMPAGGFDEEPEAEPPPAPDSGRASRRDRSFGMLLERLTAISPADDAAAPHPVHAGEATDRRPDPAAQPVERAPLLQDQPPVGEDTRFNDALPAAETPPAAVPEPVSAAVAAMPDAATMEMPGPAETPAPAAAALPAAPPRRSRAPAVVAALVLAAGAGFYAYRQQAPATAPQAPQTVAQVPAPAPAAAAAPVEPPSRPAPALTAAPVLAEAAPPAPAAAPAVPAAPVPASTSSAANAGQTPARAAPTVYVHVRSQRERERLQALTRTLAGQGIRVVDVKVMSKGPSVADLRYFHDDDRDTALTVQKALVSAGVPVPRLSRMNGYEGSTRPGHFEAWLGAAAAPEPARRR